MKKLSKLLLSLSLLLPVLTGLSQGVTQKIELSPSRETSDPRFTVTATVMDNDTWCRVVWPDPVSNPWEIAYDDGEADDYFIYANAGSMNALKFSPYQDNYIVTGGKIHVGDGSFPGPFLGTSFRVLVYDDDGEDGLPGTVLDSTEVTVENYEWVEFEGFTAQITDGSFYLAMKQTAPAPDAAPIGVDTDNPTWFNSYSYFQGAPGWVLSPLQDFMIRAFITGYNEPSRAIDSFEVARFSGFEFNESPLTGDTTVLDTITLSEYNDYGWDEFDPGLYAYGVKTHFTGGEWSDFDVSNLVTHIFYPFPPACFYQSDSGNQQLVICPPVDLNGALPNYFTGFNLYVDGDFYTFLPPSATSYLLDLPGPAIYSCMLTAVYELSLYGYPYETSESIPLFTDYAVRFGFPLPFLETWNLGNFDENNWLTDGANWSITGQHGYPSPAAEFTWDPIQSEYALALESFPFQADSMTEGEIYLDFDIGLDNVNPTGTEQMLIQVWNWDSQAWATIYTYSNQDGSFSWIAEHLDITDQAMGTVFKVRFLALGENSVNILSWFIDNIHVYRACNPPLNLDAQLVWSLGGIALNWDIPSGTGFEDQWIHWDDGALSGNSIASGIDWCVAARWTPDQLTDFEGASVTRIAFVPGEGVSTYSVRVWQGEYAANLLVDQEVPSPIMGQWNTITLNTPVPIDITQELWVGYHIILDYGYPAGVDDGPAIDGYGNMMYFGSWQTLLEINPDLDYNWSIQAFIEPGPVSDSVDKYAIYRSDDGYPYFIRDYSDTNYYLDDSLYKGLWCYYLTALYIVETDTCESPSSNVACEFVGINEKIPESSLKIYPNPAYEFLKIESSEELELISIYNSFGELMLKKKVDGKITEINVENFPTGVYLMRISMETEVMNRKIIIAH